MFSSAQGETLGRENGRSSSLCHRPHLASFGPMVQGYRRHPALATSAGFLRPSRPKFPGLDGIRWSNGQAPQGFTLGCLSNPPPHVSPQRQSDSCQLQVENKTAQAGVPTRLDGGFPAWEDTPQADSRCRHVRVWDHSRGAGRPISTLEPTSMMMRSRPAGVSPPGTEWHSG